VPHGEKLMPHKHPEDRVYTVISGIFHIGLGDEFEASKLEAYPPGAVVILPGNTPHFHWAKSSEYVTQVTAMGPLGLEYLSAKDDFDRMSDDVQTLTGQRPLSVQEFVRKNSVAFSASAKAV
jgi:uncharacterized RmlC-like cupin family protein